MFSFSDLGSTFRGFGTDIKNSLGFGSNYGSGNTANAWEHFKNGNTNDVNYQISEENLAFQKENLEYQKALQQKIFDREDSSYQRTVNDMRAAGLSPLTMNGTNSAGEAIQTEAPQRNYQHHDMSDLSAISQIASVASNFQNNQEDIKYKQIRNAYAKDDFILNLLGKRASIASQLYDNLGKHEKQLYNSFYGLNDSMSSSERIAHILGKQLGLPLSKGFDPKNSGLNLRNSIGNLNINDYSNYSVPNKLTQKDFEDFVSNISNGIVKESKKAMSDLTDHAFEFLQDKFAVPLDNPLLKLLLIQ